MAYVDDLRHPKWQRKRLEILQAADWKCSSCESEDRTLHVHHRRYIKTRKPWEYDDTDLISLCEECHRLFHAVDKGYKDLEVVRKQALLQKILGPSAKLIRRGPFAFANDPKQPTQCLVIHVPSGAWHGLTLSLEAAVSLFDSAPSQRAELLAMVLEGVSSKGSK